MSALRFVLEKVKNIPSQPCCGYFLHGATRVVGLLDFGLSLFSIIFIASEIYQHREKLEELRKIPNPIRYYIRICSWASYFVFKLILLLLSILLFKAAKKRSSKLCKIWIGLSVLTNLTLISVYLINHVLFTISSTVQAFIVFYIIYKLYCIHVVWSFVKEIECYGGFNAALSGLTDAEVEEFEKGCPPETQSGESDLKFESQGFNKDFEIHPENLEIDYSSLLGSGAFGCVYRGKLGSKEGIKSVAVKTVNPSADVAYFKTLLSELKVMTFVSHHENVVGLIGACTANIKEKKLFVVVEFCPYGNLHEYLKARRGLFVNFVKDGEWRTDAGNAGGLTGYANLNTGNTVTTTDLFKWTVDAAKGLEFLERKKVIHGDIATRNILLAYGKIAKISDFGLAKKLYQYTTVVKEEMLLPWRWMAIESLTDMEFSIKSDVWSYGTAMWEMFSLSELPFPGYSWDKEFVKKLHEGLRMSRPRNATNEIYKLMVSCWAPKPDDRPSFAVLTQQLEKMFEEVLHIYGGANDKSSGSNKLSSTTEEVIEMEDIDVYI